MTVTLISECFKTYVNSNWCESTISSPTTIAVMSENSSPSKFKGSTSSCLLVNRGDVQMIQVDLGSSSSSGGFRVRTWRTKVFFHHTTSANLQAIINEFQRILAKWQSGGGGTFSSQDTDNLKYVQDQTVIYHSARSADIDLVLNGYYEQESV